MSKRDIKFLLEDILESGKKIQDYTQDYSFENFIQDNKTVDAVVRNLEIIGEAANRIPEEFTTLNPEIPWRSLVGLRNRIVHEYFGIDLEIIWNIRTFDMPEFLDWIETILENDFK